MSDYPGTGRLEPDILAAYIDGELPPEERARVEAKIAADPESYEWLVNVIAAVDDDSITGGGERSARQGEPTPADGAELEPGPTPVPTPAPGPPGGGNRKGDGKSKVVPFYRRPSVMGGMGALAAAAALLLIVAPPQREPPRTEVDTRAERLVYPSELTSATTPVQALVNAVGPERYTEGRLTGGFLYGPLRAAARGATNLAPKDIELLTIASEFQRAAESSPTAMNLHKWGVAQILLGKPETGAETLARSLALGAPEGIATDLAVAVLAGARLTDKAADAALRFLAEAKRGPLPTDRELNSSGRSGQAARAKLAVALLSVGPEPSSREQLFNRALAYEQLGDPRRASEAWRTYLSAETDPEWKREAERRLARLQR